MGYAMIMERSLDQLDQFHVSMWGMQHLRGLMAQAKMLVNEDLDPHETGDKPLDWHSEKPGIEFHKFCSSDGWHVTPKECEKALAQYAKFGPLRIEEPHQAERWRDWIVFLRRGVQRGGFRVH